MNKSSKESVQNTLPSILVEILITPVDDTERQSRQRLLEELPFRPMLSVGDRRELVQLHLFRPLASINAVALVPNPQ
jgi:hypothetical protein